MAGYRSVQELRRLEAELAIIGLQLASPRHTGFGDADVAALIPHDTDSLPIYSRDAEVFVGTLVEIRTWLRGVEWARNYDRLLKISDDKKRARKEQDYREQRLLTELKKDHANDAKAK